MRRVTYSMGVSLDGYVSGPDDTFDWSAPDEEMMQFVTDEIRQVGVHLMGRRLYEAMLYWEPAEPDPPPPPELHEWAQMWKAIPKLVFSRTLTAVEGNARLATGRLAEEIGRLREETAEGDIAIGGATLAVQAAGLGLIDDYLIRFYPVLVGGGRSYFAREGRRENLELVESRTLGSGIVCVRHRVVR